MLGYVVQWIIGTHRRLKCAQLSHSHFSSHLQSQHRPCASHTHRFRSLRIALCPAAPFPDTSRRQGQGVCGRSGQAEDDPNLSPGTRCCFPGELLILHCVLESSLPPPYILCGAALWVLPGLVSWSLICR